MCRLQYFETSAATGQNVTESITSLLDKVMVRMESAVDKSHSAVRSSQKLGEEVDEAEQSGGCGC